MLQLIKSEPDNENGYYFSKMNDNRYYFNDPKEFYLDTKMYSAIIRFRNRHLRHQEIFAKQLCFYRWLNDKAKEYEKGLRLKIKNYTFKDTKEESYLAYLRRK